MELIKACSCGYKGKKCVYIGKILTIVESLKSEYDVGNIGEIKIVNPPNESFWKITKYESRSPCELEFCCLFLKQSSLEEIREHLIEAAENIYHTVEIVDDDGDFCYGDCKGKDIDCDVCRCSAECCEHCVEDEDDTEETSCDDCEGDPECKCLYCEGDACINCDDGDCEECKCQDCDWPVCQNCKCENCCLQLSDDQEKSGHESYNTPEERVAAISRKLQKITGTNYQAEIIRSNLVNAYADGKKIMITSAALNRYNDDELANTLGHEIAHNEAGDTETSKQRIKEAINGIAERVTKTPGFFKKVLIGVAVGGLAVLNESLTRQQEEYQADERGQKIAEQAGFDPRGAVTGLEKDGEYPSGLLSTHPNNQSRRKRLDK